MPTKKVNLSENWSNLPLVNYSQFGTIGGWLGYHPIVQSIISQISQDLFKSIQFIGDAEQIRVQKRLFSVEGWNTYLNQAIYTSIESGKSYLLLDFGDSDYTNSPPDIQPKPIKVKISKPTIHDYSESNEPGEVDEARYIEFTSPFVFPMGSVLQLEIERHNQLTDGLVEMVKGQGIIQAGIENLFEILTSNIPTAKLYSRLNQLKQANKGDGVLAYDLNREKIDIIPKQMGREVDTIRVIENRVAALTGLPSFIIWGHTDGDGYGVASSLELYSQRIQSQSQMFLVPVFTYLAELLNLDLYVETQDIFTETPAEKTDRLVKMAGVLGELQSIGAMTAIEVRNTIASSGLIDLVLDPNVQVVSNPEPTNNPQPDSQGFSV